MVWGKVKHERKFSIYLLSLALHARISSRYPRYRGSIGDYYLLYDQVGYGFVDSYDSTIILIGYVKGRSRKYDKLGA